jgi:hypothetical protein
LLFSKRKQCLITSRDEDWVISYGMTVDTFYQESVKWV